MNQFYAASGGELNPEKRFNATIDHIWADQLSPPQVHAYLKPFVKVAC
jgi:hypothetical protein